MTFSFLKLLLKNIMLMAFFASLDQCQMFLRVVFWNLCWFVFVCNKTVVLENKIVYPTNDNILVEFTYSLRGKMK